MTFKVRLGCLWMLVGAMLAFWPGHGMAATTGKVTGSVRDASGEPLPGVNVLVKGTRRGGTTDGDGYFLILAVDPGAHEVEASLVGYRNETLQNVLVQVDLTTTVNFMLQEAALALGEMVVVAERPAVEPDKTVSRYIVGVEQIEQVPLARSASEVIELQPGVSLDGAMRIRASHTASVTNGTNEVFVEVDGIRLSNDDGVAENNTSSQVNSLARGALQEVAVVTGGMNAEYGNAQGGVISLVSREAKNRFGGLGEYRLTLPGRKHWGENVYTSPRLEGKTAASGNPKIDTSQSNYDEIIGHFLEANVSGPINEQLGFFLSSYTDRQATVFPGPSNRAPSNLNTSGNLAYRPGDNYKFKLGTTWVYKDGFNNGSTRVVRGPGGATTGVPPGGVRGISENGRNLFLPEGYSSSGKSPRTDQVFYGVLTHTVSPRTFYEVRLSFQRTALDTSGVPAATQDIVRGANGFYGTRDIRALSWARRTRFLLKGDLSSQVTKGHFVKAGFEIIRNSMEQQDLVYNTTRERNVRLLGKGDPIVGMEPFNPITYGAYVQDKMEFEGLVVNLGVRLDLLDPGDSFGRGMDQVIWNHYNSLTRWRNVPIVDSPTQTAVSPRLGISHPITERSTIRFFTGRFHQFVGLQHLYNRTWRATGPDKDLNGNGQIDQAEEFNALIYPLAGEFGNIDMKPERTTNFEVGFDWNFAGNYVAGLTAFYKDQEGTLSSGGSDFFIDEPTFGFNSSYSHAFFNRRFSTSRGFELSFQKKFSKMTAFYVSYNVNWSKTHRGGKASWEWFVVPTSTYVNSDKFFSGVTVESSGQEVPRAPTAAERTALAAQADVIAQKYKSKADVREPKSNAFWEQPVLIEDGLYSFNIANYSIPTLESGVDRRNFASVQFIFSSPPDFYIRPLAGFRATMVWRMQTGRAFNYSPPSGPRERRNGPPTTLTDVSFEKDFRLGKVANATTFLEVRNLFGQQDDTGTGFRWIQYGLQKPPPGDKKFDTIGDITELTRYNGGLGRPRTIVAGARFKF
ncbi:MAG: TonB-dependent receptor [bacterium]|nr:TonB-dependent receptor [bacterium]